MARVTTLVLVLRHSLKTEYSVEHTIQNVVVFLSPVSTVCAWNAWDHDPLLATKNGLLIMTTEA